MTSNLHLNSLLKNEKHFLGCFHIRKMPKLQRLKLPASLIIYINGHWVSLLLVDKYLCLYFDSFGKGVQDKKLINNLKSVYNKIIFNKKKIQHNSSSKCGLYCLLYIILVRNRENFKKFLNLFVKRNLLMNDYILYCILKRNKLT